MSGVHSTCASRAELERDWSRGDRKPGTDAHATDLPPASSSRLQPHLGERRTCLASVLPQCTALQTLDLAENSELCDSEEATEALMKGLFA
mmetsp:Transcript_47833/g.112915  ORF Transcript_47833/g.112915 Transcript_47833/m.112915 type:complete len:91 (-) Transcript_47833:790-1062(-)